MCGTPVAVAAKGGGKKKPSATPAREPAKSNLPWVIGGAAVFVVAAALILPRLGGEEEPLPGGAPFAGPAAGAPAGAVGGGAAGVDLSSMTPREAADRLFDRVMRAEAAGDTAQARSFAPMALAAYEMVPELDLDGRYHVAVIQLTIGQAQEALDTASGILAEVPTHLLGLATAAEAHIALGQREQAAELYQTFLDSYDAEIASNRIEYQDHRLALPPLREDALAFTQGS